jgi:hypothetical protein
MILRRSCDASGSWLLAFDVLQFQQAPSWLLQLPSLLSATDYQALQQWRHATTRDRMLRELAEAVEYA